MNPELPENDHCRSRYYFEMIFHNGADKEKIYSGIYEDTTITHVAKKNKAKNSNINYAYYKYGRGKNLITITKGKIKLMRDEDIYGKDLDKGLTSLIQDKESLSEHRYD